MDPTTPNPGLDPVPDPVPDPASPIINTYHCICTTLLLATTHTLSSLPRRRGGLDQAIILPLPALHSAADVDDEDDDMRPSSSDDEDGDQADDNDQLGEGDNQDMEVEGAAALNPARSLQSRRRQQQQKQRKASSAGYSILLSTTQDRKPAMVRREDGFEKRVLLRCARCRLGVGYKLEHQQQQRGSATMVAPEEEGERSRRADVVYLLPGGLVSTTEMQVGKMPEVPVWGLEKG